MGSGFKVSTESRLQSTSTHPHMSSWTVSNVAGKPLTYILLVFGWLVESTTADLEIIDPACSPRSNTVPARVVPREERRLVSWCRIKSTNRRMNI